MKLYLMRHGQAAHALEDPSQGLTQQGRLEIENLAKRLLQQDIKFSQVFHSKKTRAMQTAQIIREILSPDADITQHNHIAPDDDPNIIIAEIDTWETDSLIASHLPFVPGLLASLVGKTPAISFVPGTIIGLSKQGNDWQYKWHDQP